MKPFITMNKVSKSYYKFLCYNSMANFLCGIQSTLTSYSMLDASGVGREHVELTTVSLNLVGKDIFGQICSVPVIQSISKLGSKKPIKHMKISLLIYELSVFVECMTPLLPTSSFIVVATMGNIGKNIGFTTMGSFNSHIITQLSTCENKNNIIELHSKIASISTVSFSVGMAAGLVFIKYLPTVEHRLAVLPFLSLSRYILLKKSVENIL